MRDDFIPDMASSAAIGAVYKTFGILGLVGVAAGAVAMALTPPKTTTEFFRRIVVTVLTSIIAGPLVIEFLGFSDYSFRSQLGICFLTGVPSWLIWSWVALYLQKSQDKSPSEIADEIRKIKNGGGHRDE